MDTSLPASAAASSAAPAIAAIAPAPSADFSSNLLTATETAQSPSLRHPTTYPRRIAQQSCCFSAQERAVVQPRRDKAGNQYRFWV
ncbi:hypothetical protein BDZ89DRAFT_1073949 [Hymenopellis radicata]|nr:hypothetical protein BDZ89DRAFT_1073949 [Hymenopellis radicata]